MPPLKARYLAKTFLIALNNGHSLHKAEKKRQLYSGRLNRRRRWKLFRVRKLWSYSDSETLQMFTIILRISGLNILLSIFSSQFILSVVRLQVCFVSRRIDLKFCRYNIYGQGDESLSVHGIYNIDEDFIQNRFISTTLPPAH